MSEMIGRQSVSRETFERLEKYVDLVRKWNPRINLVSKPSLDSLWERHFVDSAQVFFLAPEVAKTWVDLGSGGGFPGLVIAILAKEFRPDLEVTLVESDQRKCAFLRTVSRETQCNATVIDRRIEAIEPLNADIVSARALADLDNLLGFAERHLNQSGMCLFPKGNTWKKELNAARDSWRFDCREITSETQDDAVILQVKGISHV